MQPWSNHTLLHALRAERLRVNKKYKKFSLALMPYLFDLTL